MRECLFCLVGQAEGVCALREEFARGVAEQLCWVCVVVGGVGGRVWC